MIVRIFALGTLTALVCNVAIAAEVSILTDRASTAEIGRTIQVNGEITDGDDLRLRAALNDAPANTLVILTSPGGLIAPAMAMGRIIRKTGVNTIAVGVCASACGLIWLAGTKRFSMSNSQIGFHAAFSGSNSAVTGSGNALIGAYVSELGFGDNVIRYVTETPPEGMQWLNDREANLLGIEVTTVQTDEVNENEAFTAKPENNEEDRSVERLKSSAVAKVLQIVESHSGSAETVISYVDRNYASILSYYGKTLSRSEVLKDKFNYIKRWPIRNSIVRVESINASCDLETCLVTGIYDWSVSNPDKNKKAFGAATFGYGFSVYQNMPVVFEDGKVLSRN